MNEYLFSIKLDHLYPLLIYYHFINIEYPKIIFLHTFPFIQEPILVGLVFLKTTSCRFIDVFSKDILDKF